MHSAGGVTLGVLVNLPMFRQVPRAQLAELVRGAQVVHARRGEPVARSGEPPPGLMAVGYGLVKLSLSEGGGKVLRLVGAGETFGEAMLFLEQPLPVDATALCDTLVVVLPRAPLLALLERDPRFARALLASLCQRLHELVADFQSATAYGARERLAAYLEALVEPGARAAELPAPKAVVAARLGVAKETLSRLLRQFSAEGLISVAGRRITLLDRERLAAARQGIKPAAGCQPA
ncbi:MAG TPA: Crp/Fnr family transcriptional regulator [Burkholderiales bacterium]|nr:Crp/Fnr family transcriptional regulator [Burkholderiales bacterium]